MEKEIIYLPKKDRWEFLRRNTLYKEQYQVWITSNKSKREKNTIPVGFFGLISYIDPQKSYEEYIKKDKSFFKNIFIDHAVILKAKFFNEVDWTQQVWDDFPPVFSRTRCFYNFLFGRFRLDLSRPKKFIKKELEQEVDRYIEIYKKTRKRKKNTTALEKLDSLVMENVEKSMI